MKAKVLEELMAPSTSDSCQIEKAEEEALLALTLFKLASEEKLLKVHPKAQGATDLRRSSSERIGVREDHTLAQGRHVGGGIARIRGHHRHGEEHALTHIQDLHPHGVIDIRTIHIEESEAHLLIITVMAVINGAE